MSAVAEESTKVRAKPPIGILIAASAIGPLALNIFIPSMPGLQHTFSADYATVQLTLTLYLIGLAVSQLLYGPLSDRYGRRPLLLGGLGLFVLASLACSLATSIEGLIVARVLQAVGGCSGIVLGRAIVRDLYERDKAASMIGYITMAWVLAPMVAPLIGGILDTWYGWQASFYFLVIAGALVFLACLRWLHETHFDRHNTSGLRGFVAGFPILLRRREFLSYALQLSFNSGVFFSFLAGAPYVMTETLGRSPVEYGIYFALVSLGYMAGNGLAGRYSVQRGIDSMILMGLAATLIGTAIMMAFVVAGVLHPLTIFVPMLLCSLGNGLSIPNGLAGAISVRPDMAGVGSGLAGFIQMSLGAMISQLVGFLQDGAVYPLFVIMLTSAALACVANFFGRTAPTR
ncbi:multidrug effflux MFS transporter [Fodinicurvata sediminis]|uniref:multidrug effflux MFS transporter n=1 Tax=Fodinicurvata sediminis TaxID=1121832 RepID=UPI0003B4D4A8|nr:multidrug effflux MFS transporter [Fodinicurvata sediminis]